MIQVFALLILIRLLLGYIFFVHCTVYLRLHSPGASLVRMSRDDFCFINKLVSAVCCLTCNRKWPGLEYFGNSEFL